MTYYEKYLKYKHKYMELHKLQLIKQSGGGDNNKVIILFKAEWCGHCKNFKDTWANLQNKYNDKYNFVTFDADVHKKELQTFNVQSFPTLLVQNNDKVVEYKGNRTEDDIIKFIKKN